MNKKNRQLTIKDELTEFLLYTTPNGDVKVEIFFHNENVWLTQKRMSELFGVGVNTINYHLKEEKNQLFENIVRLKKGVKSTVDPCSKLLRVKGRPDPYSFEGV